MSKPKVSVCIPTYNRAHYLRATISSVLEQDFRDFEVIVSDDGSHDLTSEVVRSLSDERIRYDRNQQNLGLWGNTNQCLGEASGEYVIFLQDDDSMLPGLLRREVEVLDNHPGVVLVHAAYQQVDDASRVINVPPQSWPKLAAGLDFVRLYWSGARYAVVMSSAMFRPSIATELGGFDPRLLFSADAGMWQRMAFKGQVAFLAETLVSSRVHSGQVTSKILFDQFRMLEERLKHAESTRELVTRQGGNLDHVIARRLSQYIASDLTALRWHGVSIRKTLAYGLAGIRLHPDVLRRFSFYRNLTLSLVPPFLVRWLRGMRGRWWLRGRSPDGASDRAPDRAVSRVENESSVKAGTAK
jgi:glycosyltransferase involved in cell wall biosynthesis